MSPTPQPHASAETLAAPNPLWSAAALPPLFRSSPPHPRAPPRSATAILTPPKTRRHSEERLSRRRISSMLQRPDRHDETALHVPTDGPTLCAIALRKGCGFRRSSSPSRRVQPPKPPLAVIQRSQATKDLLLARPSTEVSPRTASPPLAKSGPVCTCTYRIPMCYHASPFCAAAPTAARAGGATHARAVSSPLRTELPSRPTFSNRTFCD